MNICIVGENDNSVREKARVLRKIVGCQNVDRFPVLYFIEKVLCAPGSGIDLEIVECEEMPTEYATMDTFTGVLRLREDVYERAYNECPRDRFTLCHELGHYFLHQPRALSFARGKVPVRHQPEHQANVFAAELLAPLTMIKGLSIDEVHERFGISKQSASYQLQKVM